MTGPFKRRCAKHYLINYNSIAPNIKLIVLYLFLMDLGAVIGGGSDLSDPFLGLPKIVRAAQIYNFNFVLLSQHDIFQLDIPV